MKKYFKSIARLPIRFKTLPVWKSFKTGLICWASYFLFCSNTLATVILYVYHFPDFYVASDSLVRGDSGGISFTTEKLFKVSDTCWVSIAGFYGGVITNSTGKRIPRFLPHDLKTICETTYSTNTTLQTEIENILSQFAPKYHESTAVEAAATNLETRLTFAGQDPATDLFFLSSYLFNGTNQVLREVPFTDTTRAHPPYIGCVGQEKFFDALIVPLTTQPTADDVLSPYRSDEFKKAIADIYSGKPISEQRVKDFILEFLRLGKQLAAKLGLDTRPISEPFRILRITPQGTDQLQ